MDGFADVNAYTICHSEKLYAEESVFRDQVIAQILLRLGGEE